ncbi:MAG TPA: ADP-ribosylation/crystallin J1 [Bacteroidia bacterium]|jgi:hypothetical protein
MKKITLYRPIGCIELELIEDSGFRSFPPRLSWQPIFYPVLSYDYACTIARDWNTNDEGSGFAGFVTKFDIPEEYFLQFEVKNVGGPDHNELWVPAGQLGEFNSKRVDKIQVVKAFYGDKFSGTKRY